MRCQIRYYVSHFLNSLEVQILPSAVRDFVILTAVLRMIEV